MVKKEKLERMCNIWEEKGNENKSTICRFYFTPNIHCPELKGSSGGNTTNPAFLLELIEDIKKAQTLGYQINLGKNFNGESYPLKKFAKYFDFLKWFEGIEGLILKKSTLKFKGKSIGEFRPIDKRSSEYGLYKGYIRPSVNRDHPAITRLEEKNYAIVTSRGTCAGGGS